MLIYKSRSLPIAFTAKRISKKCHFSLIWSTLEHLDSHVNFIYFSLNMLIRKMLAIQGDAA